MLSIEMPTHKQLQIIGYIEKNLNIVFTGGTKPEAQAFISNNIDESRKAARTFKKARIEERQAVRYASGGYDSSYYPITDANIEDSNKRLRDSDIQEMKSGIFGGIISSDYYPYDDDDFRPF
ncbi:MULTISPECIES: hypothetical protein [Bacillus]|uniref:hypothetical protein n=1 Tax=Bacillus TaxID=1386 RepID=UPI001CD4B4DE|nr:hypothetical protein [Bacillus amyloliquefaciens]